MKTLYSLLFICLLFVNSYSAESSVSSSYSPESSSYSRESFSYSRESSSYPSESSSASYESCYYTGICFYVNSVNSADINNNVQIYGSFGYLHDNLNVTIGGLPCYVANVSSNTIGCYFPYVNYLNVGYYYNVEVSQNGRNYIGYNYYYNSGINCGNGYYYYGQCICYSGYYGSNCQFVKTPYIDYASDVYGLNGGFISFSGWFTDNAYELSFYIDQISNYSLVNITYMTNNYIQGVSPSVSYEGYHYVYMVNSTNESILSSNLVYYHFDSNSCLNNCSSNGHCYNSTCMCNVGWYGPDCSSYSNSTESSTEEPSTIITCVNSGNGLTINSYTNINCTGYGPTYCVDNDSGSTCSTDQETGIIKCTVNSNWTNLNRSTSLTCTGSHIECRSSIVKCIIDLEGSFHVNDRLSTSNMVMVDDKHAKLQDIQVPNIERNSASSLSLNIVLLLSFALLLALF